MSHLSSLLTNSPFVVFLAGLIGVLFGQIEYRGVSLGSSGTLFAGLALGFLGSRVEPAYFNLSLVLFVAAVGLLAAGAIAGGMTSTPGLGAAVTVTDTEEVGAAYGATYPFALLGMVLFSKLLVLIA